MRLFFLFDFTQSLRTMADGFFGAVPGLVGAVAIIIVGLFISKAVEKLIKKLLIKSQIDKFGDKLNSIDIVDKANVEVKISTLLSKILYYFLFIFFMLMATEVLGMPAVSEVVANIFNFIPNVIVALIILMVGILVADAIKNIVFTACKSIGIPSANIISSFLFYFLLINILILALTQAKINTDFLSQNLSVVIGGVVLAFAIGYGLASKSVMANYLASFYGNGRVQIGDTISIDGEKGQITDIDKSCITLATDKKKVIIPLSKITDEKIIIHN